ALRTPASRPHPPAPASGRSSGRLPRRREGAEERPQCVAIAARSTLQDERQADGVAARDRRRGNERRDSSVYDELGRANFAQDRIAGLAADQDECPRRAAAQHFARNLAEGALDATA